MSDTPEAPSAGGEPATVAPADRAPCSSPLARLGSAAADPTRARQRAREARVPLADAPSPGDVLLVDVGGHRVGVFRVGDELYALADRCPHRGAPLCQGAVATVIEVRDGAVTLGEEHAVVRCPWHKWEFSIASGRALADPKLRVRRYAVRVDGDELVVTLDRPAEAAGG
jgi:nitrite reductase (NADH) small subunit